MVTPTATRKTQILQTLAHMLAQPQAARVTTAALAARMQVSEAALYRHFASKAQMFEGLIAEIEDTLYAIMDDILALREDGTEQIRRLVSALLDFAQTHRGKTRVLTGDALVTEDNRLVERINQITDRIQRTIGEAARNGVVDGSLPAHTDPAVLGGILTQLVLGKWLRFTQSAWQQAPLDHLAAELAWLLPVKSGVGDGKRGSPGRA